MHKFISTLIALFLLTGQGFTAHAQSIAQAYLSFVDTQAFPSMSALLDVYDTQGQFISGLEPADVTVLEDGQQYSVSALSESTPPAQVVVAVNPGPALAVRDGQGIERFKQVTDALTGWANARPTDTAPDDLSLVTIAGPIITHAKPADWVVSFTAFQPNFRTTTPNMQSLAIALNTVNEQTSLRGMKRAVLLITPHMDDPNLELILNDYAQQAIQNRVRIFVWFVDADLYFGTPSAIAFKSLALQTGGSFFAFSGLETLPDPEMYFSPLRHLYTLSYDSKLSKVGEYTLEAQVKTLVGQLTSTSQTFSLDVQSPNPVLLSPPEQIIRRAPPNDPFNQELLLPEKQTLRLIVEFPDNHPRPLARTTLIVDGKLMAQNESEPFDQFDWDLSAYTESAQHELSVGVVDSLGLNKTSVAVPVVVTVVHPPTGIQAFLAKYRLPIALIAVLLAGGILLFVLLSGRLRIKTRRERVEARKRKVDPVTQPVTIQQAEPTITRDKDRKGKQANRPHWSRPTRLPDSPAFLVRLGKDGEPITGNPIPLLGAVTSFGTDPVQSACVLDHPSIAALHARIKRNERDEFLILDNGSVAGTWVNYEAIPLEGRTLKHGDVVHFGQMSYRFTLRNPPAEVEPKVKREAPLR